MAETSPSELRRTPLHDLHVALGGRMVGFAGWSMPVQYPTGILAEHQACRTRAALFDVSHMGQLTISGPDAAAALETLVPADIQALRPGQARYTVLTNVAGGIEDDLIVTQAGDHLILVVNAGGRDADLAYLQSALPPGHTVAEHADLALLALQGPAAADVLARLAPESSSLTFMTSGTVAIDGMPIRASRLGYTGEDGFELSVDGADAERLARLLLAQPEVAPAGLGARDSLRLEAGLCLHGHDIDATTTPIEAGLAWTISERRRAEGGYPGHEVVTAQLAAGPPRKLMGIRPEGRAPAREGTAIHDTAGRPIGRVTSGGFGPTVQAPIAMGYVEPAAALPGTSVQLLVRGQHLPATIVAQPFVPHRYHR